MVVDADLHVDQESFLLEDGSEQNGSTYQLIYDYFYAFNYAAALEKGR